MPSAACGLPPQPAVRPWSLRCASQASVSILAVAAALDQPGTWGWVITTGDMAERGIVTAPSLAAADALIFAAAAPLLPPGLRVITWAYRSGGRTTNGSKHGTRPYESVPFDDLLPVCGAVARQHKDNGPYVAHGDKSMLRAQAARQLPVLPVPPAMPTLRHTTGCGPWIVACDGSVRPAGASWAFATGAGYADWDSLPAGTTSGAAEFAAYGRALAHFPDGAPVTLVTDSQSGAAALHRLASYRRSQNPRVRARIARLEDVAGQKAVTAALTHAQRLDLSVRWEPRNTHSLQAEADQLCQRARWRPPSPASVPA